MSLKPWYLRWSSIVLLPVAITVAGFIILYLLYGLTFELDGSGIRPLISFHDRAAHFDTLEQNRSQQRAITPATRQEDSMPSHVTINDTLEYIAPAGEIDAGTARSSSPSLVTEQSPHTPILQGEQTAYWTDFRGPNRNGQYDEAAIQTTWLTEGLPLLWRQPIGGGYASFVVASNRAFTIEQRRQQEVVTSYDVETGREVWTHSWDGHYRETMGGNGPRATPTWNDGRLYALGALGELRCLDATDGTLIWRQNILTDNNARNLEWATSASPLIVDDKVIVLPGGRQETSVVAYDKLTGAPIWKAFDDVPSYTSPMLVTLANVRQILVVTSRRVMGLAVDDGSLLWEYPWTAGSPGNIAQPIVIDQQRIFLSASYGRGASVIQLTPTTTGFDVVTLWKNNRMKNKFGSSVIYEGYIYGLDESILACIDSETGELQWKGGRYGYGQLLLASGHLVVLTESGDVVLVKATPERHEEVSRFSAIKGKTWNVPAISNGGLLVRNTTQMAGFDISIER